MFDKWGGLEIFISLSLIQAAVDAWTSFVYVLINGGWVLFALFIVWCLFILRWIEKVTEYGKSIEWVYLNVSMPELVSPSILAAEMVFAQLHATKKKYDWRERWILGMYPTWFSLEIVSLGGLVRFIIKTPKVFADSVRSAFFAQFPDIEITEVGDYMEALRTPYNPDEADYDLWGTELKLEKGEAYPIKTYPLFEHRAAEIIMDPLAGLLETMANIEPEEMFAVQILAMPAQDDWKEKASKEIQKLKGAPETKAQEEEQPPSLLQHLSENEKGVITAMQTKLGKLSYLTKIRFLYAAPKGKMDVGGRIPSMLGAFSQFSAYDLNAFDINKATATKKSAKYSEAFEARSIRETILWKKRVFIKNFKNRDLGDGGNPFHMTTDEIATLFHFPLENVRKGAIEKTDARKGEPPVNLPV